MSWKIIGLITSAFFIVVLASLSTLIWAVHSGSAEAATTPPIVATPVGRFVGVITTSKIYGNSYVAYKSIPFAKPPIDDLRFKRPQPLDNVDQNKLYNNNDYQKSCWSVTKKSTDPNYGEDCLYLNIYISRAGEIKTENKMPVLIWIHGGGFVAGGTFPEPDKLVMSGNIIVVSINYRLGVFGFLTMNDDELPSNNGLWDQYLAIKWVKDYINFFGGDDESITLFGESSGAISAALHVLSPLSSPLFKKAILQSGGATSLISRYSKQRAKEFSVMTGCSKKSSSEIAECLRNLSIDDILKFSKASAFNISEAQRQIDFIWMPVIDGRFIPDEPLKLLKNVKYLEEINAFNKDLLIGVLNNEGSLLVDHIINPINQSRLSDESFVNDLTSCLLHGRYGPDYNVSQKLKEKIYSFYTGSHHRNSAFHPQNVMELSGDVNFIVPAVEMALALSNCRQSITPSCFASSSEPTIKCNKTTSKTYLYHFDYCPQADDLCKLACMTHGADTLYEFPKSNFTNPVQQELSNSLVNLVIKFAESSNPGAALTIEWPTFDTVSQSYLRFDIYPSIRRYLYDYRVKFWLTQLPQI